MAAASAQPPLCPSSPPLPLSAFHLLTDVTDTGKPLRASLTDPLNPRRPLFFALQSLVISARLIWYPPPPPARPSPPTLWGELRKAPACQGGDTTHSQAAQRHEFEMFKANCTLCICSVQTERCQNVTASHPASCKTTGTSAAPQMFQTQICVVRWTRVGSVM